MTLLDDPACAAGSLHLPLTTLVSALDQLIAQPPRELPAAHALREAAVLLTQLERLRALALLRVADVDARALYVLDGSPSTGTWIADQHTSTDRSAVALARKLDRMPQVSAQIVAGRLSVDGGVRIGKALDQLRRHVDRLDGLIDGQPGEEVVHAVVVDGGCLLAGEARGGLEDTDPYLIGLRAELTVVAAAPLGQLERLEAAFVLLARYLPPDLLDSALRRLVDAVLPSELEQRAGRTHRERSFELHRDEDSGGWTVRGRLDVETGELLHTALHAVMATDPDNPTDTEAAAAERALGPDPYDDGCRLVRSLRQRRHDALRLMLRALLDTGVLGSRNKVVPHLAVTVSLDALHAAPGALPARAASGARLPASLARRWLCDSAITRFVLSLGNKVFAASHSQRTLTPHERKIKHVETGGICQGAGCTRGPTTGHRLIPHHPTPYAIVATTSLRDTVLVCEVTHHDIHEGARTIRLKDGRCLGPNGWVDGPVR